MYLRYRDISARLLFCITLFLFSFSPASATNLTLDQGRFIVRQALQNGDFGVARQLALGLLQANPDDYLALVVAALSHMQLNDFATARGYARRAFSAASTKPQKFEASRIAALVAAKDERHSASQFWLRRASTYAQDPQQTNVIARDYAIARYQNPWRLSGSFSIVPSNNINGGTFNTTPDSIDNFTGTFSGDARALSGYVLTATGTVDYRFFRNPRFETMLGLSAYRKHSFLSDEAKQQSPDSENGDFDIAVDDVRLSHLHAFDSGRLFARLGFGTVTYGGEELYSYGRLNGAWSAPLNDYWTWTLAGMVEEQYDPETSDPKSLIKSATFRLTYTLPNKSKFRLSYTYKDTDSENFNSVSSSRALSLGYSPARNWGPATMSFDLTATDVVYPIYVFLGTSGGRQDKSLKADISATFSDLSFAGFSPKVTYSISETKSDVARFDIRSSSLSLVIVSNF